jgi:hypothetical protein
VDVGEADRYAILFTRERGRIAARVPAARRLGSSKAALLPSAYVSVVVRAGSAGFMVNQVQTIEGPVTEPLSAFTDACQGLEMLMQVLQEEDPQEELFDVTLAFLRAGQGKNPEHAFLIFGIRFLSLLGVFPGPDDLPKGTQLSDEEKEFLKAVIAKKKPPVLGSDKGIRSLLRVLLPSVLVSPLKSPGVVQSMR